MEQGGKKKKESLRAGFEPARAMPIGFQVQRLNHSAITAVVRHNIYYIYIMYYPKLSKNPA